MQKANGAERKPLPSGMRLSPVDGSLAMRELDPTEGRKLLAAIACSGMAALALHRKGRVQKVQGLVSLGVCTRSLPKVPASVLQLWRVRLSACCSDSSKIRMHSARAWKV